MSISSDYYILNRDFNLGSFSHQTRLNHYNSLKDNILYYTVSLIKNLNKYPDSDTEECEMCGSDKYIRKCLQNKSIKGHLNSSQKKMNSFLSYMKKERLFKKIFESEILPIILEECGKDRERMIDIKSDNNIDFYLLVKDTYHYTDKTLLGFPEITNYDQFYDSNGQIGININCSNIPLFVRNKYY